MADLFTNSLREKTPQTATAAMSLHHAAALPKKKKTRVTCHLVMYASFRPSITLAV